MGTWDFLKSSLEAARQNNETVWLAYHFGPLDGESSVNYNVHFTDLISQYQVKLALLPSFFLVFEKKKDEANVIV